MTASTKVSRDQALELAREARAAKAAALHEEILWFLSFGWSKRKVAERLGVTVDAVEKRLREGPPS